MKRSLRSTIRAAGLAMATLGLSLSAYSVCSGAAASTPTPSDTAAATTVSKPLDRTGKKRTGKASYYAKRFTNKKMADGEKMDPHRDAAASKTLPLGTTAKVTNLETGKSAVVTITDRGPFVGGRIVDLSPSTADKIGITHQEGVAKVEVAPISVPLAGGGVKEGAGAKDVGSTEAKSAVSADPKAAIPGKPAKVSKKPATPASSGN